MGLPYEAPELARRRSMDLPYEAPELARRRSMGRSGFEPLKAYSQQIYSLPRLAASVPTRTPSGLAF